MQFVLNVRPNWSRVHAQVDRVVSLLPPEFRHHDTTIGLVEALSNSILHGALRVPSRQDGEFEGYITGLHGRVARGRKRVRGNIVVTVFWQDHGAVAVRIDDPGPGCSRKSRARRKGRGLDVIHKAFRAATYKRGGSSVLLSLRTMAEVPS